MDMKYPLDFYKHVVYTMNEINTSRGIVSVKTCKGQAQCLTREWGKAQTEAPHCPIPCALRAKSVDESQSLGRPEKAGFSLV